MCVWGEGGVNVEGEMGWSSNATHRCSNLELLMNVVMLVECVGEKVEHVCVRACACVRACVHVARSTRKHMTMGV